MPDHPVLKSIVQKIAGLVSSAAPGIAQPGLIVGLSGGPDSVLLLLAARQWARQAQAPLAAAHLDHGLRGGEAGRDAEFCRDLCADLGVEFFTSKMDVRASARARGGGLEEAGRHLRRRFFFGLVEEHAHLHAVATGHHRDDQTETIVMRLFRGTGPDGLLGIRPVSGPVIHPMLGVTRQEIVACLEDCRQPWRQDASNVEGDNLRARMRRELLPVIKGIFGAGAVAAPARLAELLGDDLALLDDLAAQALSAARDSRAPKALRVATLVGLSPALGRRVLRRWLEDGQPPELERVHIDSALAWLANGQSGTGLDLPGGITLRREFDLVRTDRTCGDRIVLRNGGDYRIVVNSQASDAPMPEDPCGVGDPNVESSWRLTCPANALQGNLQIRNWRPGDRFQPFGLEGTKKLSDLLRERQIPSPEREGVLVVCDETGILWVVGLARAERTRLLPSPARTVTISVVQRSNQPKQGNDIR